MRYNSGLKVFDLTGNGARPMCSQTDESSGGKAGCATRRERANAALIRHRQRHDPIFNKATLEVWEKLLAWKLGWEHSILRYRDGNDA